MKILIFNKCNIRYIFLEFDRNSAKKPLKIDVKCSKNYIFRTQRFDLGIKSESENLFKHIMDSLIFRHMQYCWCLTFLYFFNKNIRKTYDFAFFKFLSYFEDERNKCQLFINGLQTWTLRSLCNTVVQVSILQCFWILLTF